MRFWDPLVHPERKRTRSRNLQVNQEDRSEVEKRPLFSRADEEHEPQKGLVTGEARLDDVVPVDDRPGSRRQAQARKAEVLPNIKVAFSAIGVASPPTDAEITEAFGKKSAGFVGVIISGGQAWLVVRSRSDEWWYEQLTKAV